MRFISIKIINNRFVKILLGLLFVSLNINNVIAEVSVGAVYGTGPDSYSAETINAGWVDDEYRWQVDVSVLETESGTENTEKTEDKTIAIAHYFDNEVSLSGNHENYEEKLITIKTNTVGLMLPINRWFEYDRSTTISLDYSNAMYAGKGGQNKTFTRKGVTAGLNQTITDDISAGISYTSYSYSVNPISLAILFAATGRRDGLNILRGLVDNSWSINTDWQINDKSSFGVDYTYVNNFGNNLGNSDSTVISLYGSHNLTDEFSVNFNLSRIDQGSKDLAGNDIFSTFTDLGVSYTF